MTLKNSGDLLFCALLLLIASALMKHFGVGTSDLFAWFRRGENPTRQRAGDMLRRVRLRLAEPHRRRRQFDIATARVLETQLCQIRFGRAETWPPVLAVFRAVRRLL